MSTLKDINTKIVDFDLVNGLREKIDFFQSETTASLVLNFKNKGEKFDLTNISSIKAYMVKPDNTKSFITGAVVNAVEGTVKFELTNNILAVPGNIATTLIMYEGETDNKLYQKFNIKCKDTDYDEEAVESTNEFSALQEALEQAQTGGVGVDKVKQIIKGLIADGELEVQAYDDTEIKNEIGTLTNLTTTNKTSLVDAINEVKAAAGTGGSTSSLTNQNGGGALKIWAGSQAEYDALSVKYDDVVYLIDVNSTSTTIECTGLSLNNSTLTFTDSNSQTLTATKTPSNTTKSLTWSVSPGGIVTVSSGVVTPVSNGSAIITATCGSQTATCNVTVNIETPITKYTITNNLTNVTSNNSATSANENDSYLSILTANSGYELSNVTVTMGETDITTTAYSNGSINISSVTGNIVITATATQTGTTSYTINNNLTNCTNSNAANSIEENSSYSATISPDANYTLGTVTVTMGDDDISSTAVSGGTISIANVTGDIVITATATENASTEEDTVIINKYYSSTGELARGGTGSDGIYDITSTLYRTVTPGTTVTITTPSAYKHTICEYDSSKTFIKRNKNTATNLSEYSVTLSDTTAYVRIGIGSISTTGEPEETLKASYDSTTITNANPSSCSSQNIVTE